MTLSADTAFRQDQVSWWRCFLAVALALLALVVGAADISESGGWSETINASDLIAGAGSDFHSPITSSAYQAALSISDTGGAAWTIGVRRTSSSLPTGVAVAVRRTTSGSGDGSVSGGESFLTVGGTEQILCSGTGDRSGIGLQLRLTGASVEHGSGSFSATLTYRVY